MPSTTATLQNALLSIDVKNLFRTAGAPTAFRPNPLKVYREEAEALLNKIGLPTPGDDSDYLLDIASGDRVYEVIATAAPEVAKIIDETSAKVKSPFWKRKAIRNSFAGLIASIVLALYVVGIIIPGPMGAVVAILLSITGWSPLDVYGLLRYKSKDDMEGP